MHFGIVMIFLYVCQYLLTIIPYLFNTVVVCGERSGLEVEHRS